MRYTRRLIPNLMSLLSQDDSDYPIETDNNTRQAILAKLRNPTLTKGQAHQLRVELNNLRK